MKRNKLPTGEALRDRAEALGVVITVDDPNESSGAYAIFRSPVSEFELQKRVLEAERHFQTLRMGLVAIIAAVASVLSAITALIAVYLHWRFQ